MLALGKAIMLEPELLLIDELSLGLAPIVVQRLLGIVEKLKAQGTTMVLVEQSVNVALSVAEDHGASNLRLEVLEFSKSVSAARVRASAISGEDAKSAAISITAATALLGFLRSWVKICEPGNFFRLGKR